MPVARRPRRVDLLPVRHVVSCQAASSSLARRADRPTRCALRPEIPAAAARGQCNLRSRVSNRRAVTKTRHPVPVGKPRVRVVVATPTHGQVDRLPWGMHARAGLLPLRHSMAKKDASALTQSWPSSGAQPALQRAPWFLLDRSPPHRAPRSQAWNVDKMDKDRRAVPNKTGSRCSSGFAPGR